MSWAETLDEELKVLANRRNIAVTELVRQYVLAGMEKDRAYDKSHICLGNTREGPKHECKLCEEFVYRAKFGRGPFFYMKVRNEEEARELALDSRPEDANLKLVVEKTDEETMWKARRTRRQPWPGKTKT